MKNQKQLTLSHFNSFFSSLPEEILLNEFLPNMSIRAALSLVRTNKKNHTDFNSKFVGLWDRTISPNQLIQTPLLSSLKLIDVCTRLSSILDLCNKNILLFNHTYNTNFLETSSLNSILNKISSALMTEDTAHCHLQIKPIFDQAISMESEIYRYSKLKLLYFFIGFLGGNICTIIYVTVARVTYEILLPFFKCSVSGMSDSAAGIGLLAASIAIFATMSLWHILIERSQVHIQIGNFKIDDLLGFAYTPLYLTSICTSLLVYIVGVLEILIRRYYLNEKHALADQTVIFIMGLSRIIY